jgi:hypothetical protein
MQNPFIDIDLDEDEAPLPAQLKDRVMGSINTVKLITDCVDLFFAKSVSTAGRSLGATNYRNNEE